MDAFNFLIDSKILVENHKCNWDIFISAYNDSDRVKNVFSSIKALNKTWWIVPEYSYAQKEIQHLPNFVILDGNERKVVDYGLSAAGYQAGKNSLCVDITGLMRPQILYLLATLKKAGVLEFDLLYTEPLQYSRKADTKFALSEDITVSPVALYNGTHTTDSEHDVLILGVGYDHHLISHVQRVKESAHLIQMHSFPSLSADMYHESILRLDRVWSDKPGRPFGDVFFTSANDPFVTAASLTEAVGIVKSHRKVSNWYFSPLATKAQVVGFGLFYLKYLDSSPSSIIFPNSPTYNRETSKGVGRSWVYPINFS